MDTTQKGSTCPLSSRTCRGDRGARQRQAAMLTAGRMPSVVCDAVVMPDITRKCRGQGRDRLSQKSEETVGKQVIVEIAKA